MFVPATSKAIHRQAFIGDIAQTWFSICSPPAWRTRWFIYCISNRISMVKVIHIAYLSFRLFTDFASAEIVYSFCILWQCKKSNFQKGQFSISLLRRRLCTRNNTYWESSAHRSHYALFWYCSAHLLLVTTIHLLVVKLCNFLQLEATFVANLRN